MTEFRTAIGTARAFITVDNRFKVEVRRDVPPLMACGQLVLKVYPITDGEAWDEPCEVFAVDEAGVIELEREARK